MGSPRSRCSSRSPERPRSRPASAAWTSPPRSPAAVRATPPSRRRSPSGSAVVPPSRCTRGSSCSVWRPYWPGGIAAKLGSRVARDPAGAEHPGVIYLPAVTAIVAAAFALVVLRQYAGHRKTYQLMWATGFAMFAIAAFAGYLARSGGTTESEYRVFYLFGAILNVAWLALGTLYLLAPRRWADLSLAAVALLSLVAA